MICQIKGTSVCKMITFDYNGTILFIIYYAITNLKWIYKHQELAIAEKRMNMQFNICTNKPKESYGFSLTYQKTK